jgi:hypothetical protein
MYLLGEQIVPLFTIFLLDFGIVQTVLYFVFIVNCFWQALYKMLVLLVCCLILNQGLRVDSVEFKDEVPITGTANVTNLKNYIDSKIQEAIGNICTWYHILIVAL